MGDEEIKKCPWCGQIPDEIWELKDWWYMECMTKHCPVNPGIMDGHPNRESLIAAWNTRAE